MSEVSTNTAPAGWYEDPEVFGYQRYWDGHAWTLYREPFPARRQPAVTQQVVVNAPPKRVNHLLHLILTLLSAGLWLPVWIIVSMAKS
jgi:hypothetical protein